MNDTVTNLILCMSSAALAMLMSRLWARRRAAGRFLRGLFDQAGTFRVTGTDRRDGKPWARDMRAEGAAVARRKADALGVDVASVERMAA